MRLPFWLRRSIEFDEAAAQLCMATREIRRTARRRGGDLVTTRDGRQYLLIPADRPDATGHTGLVWWRQPDRQHLRDRLPTYTKRALS